MNSEKNVKIRDFHYILFEQQKSKIWSKMIVQTIYFIPRLKTGGVIAISLVAMATATLILFLDVVFELVEERVWFIYFCGSPVNSFCSLCLFFREIKRKL